MGFYGLNLISLLIIFIIALLLFGPNTLSEIVKDIRLIWKGFISILLFKTKKQSKENKNNAETNITSG